MNCRITPKRIRNNCIVFSSPELRATLVRVLVIVAMNVGLIRAYADAPSSIGISFGPSNQDILAPTDLAGAPGYAQTNWNNYFATTGTIVDSSGATTAMQLTLDSTKAAVGYSLSSGKASGPDEKLMDGVLVKFPSMGGGGQITGNATVSIIGIPYDQFSLVVYAGSNQAGSAVTFFTPYTFPSTAYGKTPDGLSTGYIDGNPATAFSYLQAGTNANSPTANSNYAVFQNISNVSTFNFTFGSFPAGGFLSGFQIIQTPDSVSWAAPSGGAWSTPGNWSPSVVPASNINANFNTGSTSPYTVTLSSGASSRNMTVSGDNVIVNLGANQLTLAGTLVVSESNNRSASFTLAGSNGGGITAPGGVSVGSVSSTAKSASFTVQGVAVSGDITNYGTFTTLANPTLTGAVTNNGVFRTWPSSGNIPAAGNVVHITKDFTQASTGTLAMQVQGTSQFDQLNIGGTAHLAGTLDITWSGSGIPALGNTFPIMTYGAVSGRFSAMTGAAIKDVTGAAIPAASNEFFGLLYGSNTLNLITLQVPQRANGTSLTSQGAAGLVLLTHGWNSNAAAWATSAAANIQVSKNQSGVPISQNWDVVSMDWSQFSGSVGQGLNWNTASVNGNDIGESLANWLGEKQFNYQDLHLVGHSAGSWLINGLTNGLRNQGSSAFVQQTYLDAYNPNTGLLRLVGLSGYSSTPVLGSNANYAEQYYDSQNLLVPGLDTALPNAVNFDVVNLKTYVTYTPVGAHQWPYVWYGNTILFPTGTDSANGFGFGQSIEYTGKQPQFAPGSMGARVSLPSKFFYNSTQYGEPVDLLGVTHVNSGTVQSAGQGVVQLSAGSTPASPALSTAITVGLAMMDSSLPSDSPAILTDQIVLTTMENLLSFSGQFLSSGHGLLTAYFDGAQITQIDERDVSSDPWSARDVYLGGDIQPGIHTLMLRLDPYDGLSSTVNVANVEFGAGTISIPEPSFGVIPAVGAMILLRRRRSA